MFIAVLTLVMTTSRAPESSDERAEKLFAATKLYFRVLQGNL
jgi:hypothetical protein